MKDILNRSIKTTLITSVIAIIVALIMIFNPSLSAEMLGYIIGAYLVAYGVIRTGFNLGTRGLKMSVGELIIGIAAVILGVIVIMNPAWISAILAVAVGIFIILSGVEILSLAFITRSETTGVGLILFGILDLILGFVVIFNPFKSVLATTVLIGIVILIHAIIRISDVFIVKKNVKQIAKMFKK